MLGSAGGVSTRRVIFTVSDGYFPQAGLTLSGSMLYGTTAGGGSSDAGTVFKLNTNGSGYTVLKYFSYGSGGANPLAGLTLSGSTLYGTTRQGGSSFHGSGYWYFRDKGLNANTWRNNRFGTKCGAATE